MNAAKRVWKVFNGRSFYYTREDLRQNNMSFFPFHSKYSCRHALSSPSWMHWITLHVSTWGLIVRSWDWYTRYRSAEPVSKRYMAFYKSRTCSGSKKNKKKDTLTTDVYCQQIGCLRLAAWQKSIPIIYDWSLEGVNNHFTNKLRYCLVLKCLKYLTRAIIHSLQSYISDFAELSTVLNFGCMLLLCVEFKNHKVYLSSNVVS